MSTANGDPAPSEIREDILAAIRRIHPGRIVDIDCDVDDSYLWNVYSEIQDGLSEIEGATLPYEREWEGNPDWEGRSNWDDDEDSWEDLPMEEELISSYHLFFLELTEVDFKFTIENDEDDEWEDDEDDEDDWDDEEGGRRRKGTGTVGCAVAVSVLTPFALIEFSDRVAFDDGSLSEPDIFSHVFDVGGEPVDMGAYFQESMGDRTVQRLASLREDITRILKTQGVTVVPAEEAKKPVPWLRPEEGVLAGAAGEELTVRDAFFFRSMG